jgi:DNA-nicking Smr family endonuclease
MARDVDLFKAAMADVAPIKNRRKVPVATAPKAITERRRDVSAEESPRASRTPAASAAPTQPASAASAFDRDVDRALSRGRRAPEASLDLHGMTLAAAERAVGRFLEEAIALDMRLVLIVTGKGLREVGGRVVGGRIREEFPGWLNRADNRAKVRSVKAAHPRHGGSGAFYVLLRRRRA